MLTIKHVRDCMNQVHPNKPDAKQSGCQGLKVVVRPDVKRSKGGMGLKIAAL
jgi:hypothetical protein